MPLITAPLAPRAVLPCTHTWQYLRAQRCWSCLLCRAQRDATGKVVVVGQVCPL